jgi:hypothetical protein
MSWLPDFLKTKEQKEKAALNAQALHATKMLQSGLVKHTAPETGKTEWVSQDEYYRRQKENAKILQKKRANNTVIPTSKKAIPLLYNGPRWGPTQFPLAPRVNNEKTAAYYKNLNAKLAAQRKESLEKEAAQKKADKIAFCKPLIDEALAARNKAAGGTRRLKRRGGKKGKKTRRA